MQLNQIHPKAILHKFDNDIRCLKKIYISIESKICATERFLDYKLPNATITLSMSFICYWNYNNLIISGSGVLQNCNPYDLGPADRKQRLGRSGKIGNVFLEK